MLLFALMIGASLPESDPKHDTEASGAVCFMYVEQGGLHRTLSERAGLRPPHSP